jgi:hypothetical protein
VSQIDLEDMISRAHPTAAAYADQVGVPVYRVYRSVRLGTLVADQSKRPMTIKEGEVALSGDEWRGIINPALARIRPSQYAWLDSGRTVQVLRADGGVSTWSVTLTRAAASRQRVEIDECPAKRLS